MADDSSQKASRAVETAMFLLTLFSFVLLFSGIIISTLYLLDYTQRMGGAYYFCGRYYEYMALPLLLLGMAHVL